MKAVIHTDIDPATQLDIPAGGRWWSFDVHYFNGGGVVIGPTPGATFGRFDVAATGSDEAEAWGNAVRVVTDMGHDVDQVTVNL